MRPDAPPAPQIIPSIPPASSKPVVEAPLPEYSKHLSVINAGEAHSAGLTGKGVRIGIVDSGVTHTHPSLSPRVVANLTYVDPKTNNTKVDDVAEHGTAVAQVAAGAAFGAWPGGVAPGAEIVSARIIGDTPPKDDGTGSGNSVSGALGLAPIHQDLIARGVRVMNNSWGGLYWTDPAATAPIAEEYRPFIQQNGGLVVFATGNEGRANPTSMAALPSQAGPGGTLPAADLERGWLAVTAVNPDDTSVLDSLGGRIYANACGYAMDYCLAAPGSVVVTNTDDTPSKPTYWKWQGTSFAAPQVSGAAALVWEAFPYFNNDLVRQTLLGTATDIGAPGVDAVFGYGLLDVASAIKGPARLDWGDVTAQFDGATSTWGNTIVGTGGLIKKGTGTLELTDAQYDGLTQVQAGTLLVGKMDGTSGAVISAGATMQLRGPQNIGGNVKNDGTLAVTCLCDHVIVGDLEQGANARYAFEVGSVLSVGGVAKLNNSEMHVLGKAEGYVPTWGSPYAFLTANGGVNGVFGKTTVAAGVLLEGRVDYTAEAVWLTLTRLEVPAVAKSLGLTTSALGSAQRVEGAFDAIESGELGGTPVGSSFVAGAGAIQGSPTAAAAQRTLESLSGEVHSADTSFALMAIEGNRRALESRIDHLQDTPKGGTWFDNLDSQRALSGFDMQADGWMAGQDYRFGNMTYGAALAQTEGYAYHDQRFDRERNRQLEAQVYASYDVGNGYVLGSIAVGNMQRWTRRDVVLGNDAFRIGADYAQRYTTAGVQAGMPIELGRARITPYAGVQSLRLDREGFSEDGAAGFGLSSDGSTLDLTQALLGARYITGWQMGSTQWDLQGRVEWQRLLSQSGSAIDARFTAVDVWSPILGAGLDRDVGVLGFGIGTWLRGNSRLGLNVDARRDMNQTWTQAMLNWSTAF